MQRLISVESCPLTTPNIDNSVSATEKRTDVVKILKTRKILLTAATSTVILLVVVSIIVYFVTRSREPDDISTTTLTTPTTTTTFTPNINHIISREEWGAAPPLNQNNITEALNYLVVKHTAGTFCRDLTECKKTVRDIQSEHMANGAPDIWYNFLIGGDGNIYIGRGWNVENENTRYSIDIAFIGNYTKGHDEVSPLMDNAGKIVIDTGAGKGVFEIGFKVVNYYQMACTTSPGENVAKVVELWDNYSNYTVNPCQNP